MAAIVVVLLLVIGGVINVTRVDDLRDAAMSVDQTHHLIESTQRFMSRLQDAETGQRGYLLTGQPEYLEPYQEAVEKIDEEFGTLKSHVTKDPHQVADLQSLDGLVDAKLQELDETIQAFNEVGSEEAIEIVRSDRGQRIMEKIRQVISRLVVREQTRLESRFAEQDSSYRLARWSGWIGTLVGALATAIFSGYVLYYFGRSETEREQARRREQQLQVTLSSIGDAVITTDADGRVTRLNRIAEELTGWSSEEAGGRPLEEIFVIVNESTRETVDNPALRALREGITVGLANHTVLLARNGKEHPIDDSAAPIRDEFQQIAGSILVFRDVSQQREHERLLSLSENRFRKAIVHAAMPIVMHDDAGTVLAASEAWGQSSRTPIRSGQPIPAWLMKVYMDHLPPGSGLSELSAIQGTEVTFQTPDGEDRVWSVSASVTRPRDEEGAAVIVSIAEDISDRVQSRRELVRSREEAEAASRSRGEFLANMSHEIRTPMTAIMGHADILRENLQDPDNLQWVETIIRNGNSLLQIINDILDLSKIDAQKLQITPQPVQPSELLADIESLMTPSADSKRIGFSIHFDGPIPKEIQTDPIRLRQILVNLVGNAIKFTDRGFVRVDVRYELATGKLRFKIRDTGIGIADEHRHRIFESFEQADSSHSRSFGGTGLGLAISRRLALALGGDISVESELNAGSAFELCIDCGDVSRSDLIDATLRIRSEKRSSPEPRLLPQCTVLAVDDRRDIRFLVRRLVENAGGTVIDATNGQEAVDLLVKKQDFSDSIDVVVMDMQMPIMDGYAAARRLRELNCAVPILALTANAMVEDREACLNAGCNDYCTKPIDARIFLEKIQQLVEGDLIDRSSGQENQTVTSQSLA